MKKIMVIILAGIMAMTMVTGCGSNKKSDRKAEVEVDVGVVDLGDGNYATEYIYKSEDFSEARRLCKENQYEHLDNGETVSEMIITSDDDGNEICYFRVIHVAG